MIVGTRVGRGGFVGEPADAGGTVGLLVAVGAGETVGGGVCIGDGEGDGGFGPAGAVVRFVFAVGGFETVGDTVGGNAIGCEQAKGKKDIVTSHKIP
mmetsp:Transcript_13391/g.24225  ORF Transcript_13391/g.24225 Transcript_13391/m.24225 type:complete len:97 (-) Transcript_13391:223-513(-)